MTFTVKWAGENLDPHVLCRLAQPGASVDLADAAKMIEELRLALLFDAEAMNGLGTFAESQALLALAALDLAHRHMQLADREQARALAEHGGP